MIKIIDVTILEGVNGLCFIECPICWEDILVTIDKWTKCKNGRNRRHSINKKVYRMIGNKIVEAEVDDYNKSTLETLDNQLDNRIISIE